MLEVMSAGSTGLSRTDDGRGILLNSWDKASPLIRELERTVNFAERKCGDLMQQLHFYKEYYEKWAQVEQINHLCHKKRENKFCKQTPDDISSSENEFEKANQYFYNKIKDKIDEMNNEITEVNRKIQSRNQSFLYPPKIQSLQSDETLLQEYDSSLNIENKTCLSEPTMAYCDAYPGGAEGVKVTGKQSSKSVPARSKVLKIKKKDSLFASSRRCSSLQRYKLRSKSLPQGIRRKFGFGGFFEVFEPERVLSGSVRSRSKSKLSLKAETSKSSRSRRSRTRITGTKRLTPKSSLRRIKSSKSDVKHFNKSEKNDAETNKNESSRLTIADVQKSSQKEGNSCKAIVPSGNVREVTNNEIVVNSNLKTLLAKPNTLLPFLRNPIPFIPCSSTSKSFNLGLNVQQVLSLIKRKRHSVTLQAIVRNSMQAARSIAEPTVNTLFISQTTTSHSQMTSAICPGSEGSEDALSFVTHNRSQCSILKQVQTMRSKALEGKINTPKETIAEVNKVERPEDVWVVEQPDPASKKLRDSRSRCTCFPTKNCVDYHKVLRQYTGWRLPASQGDIQSSIMYSKPKLYNVPSRDSIGFGKEGNSGRVEVIKVHNDLHNLARKYSLLQDQISQNSLGDCEASAEIDAMESELALREIEFKDILSFYNQLMLLKEKLKALKARTAQNQRAPECPRPKKDPLRPTPSMALAKALKKIQGLQDKIKLIDTP